MIRREDRKWTRIKRASKQLAKRNTEPRVVDEEENPFCTSRRLNDAIELSNINKV